MLRPFLLGIICALLALLFGCGPVPKATNLDEPTNEEIYNPPPKDGDELPPPDSPPSLNLCLKLPFNGVQFPQGLIGMDLDVFKLALDLSGSYEGDDGWKNLTNNFDGTGLSLGLLNQTLGTGSLQPIMISTRNNHGFIYDRIFSSANRQSLLGMLSKWENGADATDLIAMVFSRLDGPGLRPVASARNNLSVKWAVDNIYNGNSFKPEWKKQLTSLASAPEYVGAQVQAAKSLFDYAMRVFPTIGVPEVRTFLFLFDIAVQNGGLYNSDIVKYRQFISTNPSANSTEKLLKLLEFRLTHVRPQYRDDVSARKKAIINGVGRVHGAQRQFELEYCFNRLLKFH